MTNSDPLLRRRNVLRSSIALATIPLAGCTGSGGEPGDGAAGDRDGDGLDDPGDGETNQRDGDDPPGTVGIGESTAGGLASLTVESVRTVDEILDYSEFPDVDAETPYGIPRDVGYFQEQGLAGAGTAFYGIGIAVTNTGDRLLDVRTIQFRTEDDAASLLFGGRSQRLTFARGYLLPGETVRAEVVPALASDPSSYTMTLRPMVVGTGRSELLSVDLGSGSEGRATYGQSPPVGALDDAIPIGDFEVTIHDAEFVDRVRDTVRPETFGSRPGYRYLLVDLSATRRSDVTVPGGVWRVGLLGDDGYGFAWGTGSISMYHDVTDTNRTRVDRLSVDETIEHTRLAFAVEDGFDPAYLTMIAPGPLEDPPEVGTGVGMNRAVWRIP